jgi:hypothetical protein
MRPSIDGLEHFIGRPCTGYEMVFVQMAFFGL